MRSHLEALIRRARRRYVAGRLLGAFVTAITAALGTFLLVLVVGASVLDWRLCLLVFAGTAGWKLWPLRRVPSLYAVAQRVDHKLGYPDTLSTALFFSRATHRRASDALKAAQRQLAEELSRIADVRRAAPIEIPRALRLTCALAVGLVVLLGVRFHRYGALDLQPPVAPAMLGLFGWPAERASAAPPRPRSVLPGSFPAEGLELDDEPVAADGVSAGVALPETDVPQVNNEQAASYRFQDKPEASAPSEDSYEVSEDGGGDGNSRGDTSAESQSRPERLPNSRGPSRNAEDSGLLARLRDAMADLLNRLKIQPDFGESRTVSERARMASERQQSGPGQRAVTGQSPPAAGEEGHGENVSEQPSGEEMARGGQGRSGERSGEQPAPGKDRSGIGKEEGSKELREAEQLAAMGKLSELIGRRAQNVSGEVTVEVLSSRQQQLKTPYTEKTAVHRDSGGQIHRDEVPLIFQEYIQRYFEEVHKSASAPK
ncbi:MAG: hypothetical protein RMK57_04535 [Bryobacterales bacterium]|nr:hypothetical protein [Bryobacteraceae bacterium]MDW8353779.1 hypothetical protein [Bryobacterales bacterium]